MTAEFPDAGREAVGCEVAARVCSPLIDDEDIDQSTIEQFGIEEVAGLLQAAVFHGRDCDRLDRAAHLLLFGGDHDAAP